MGEAPPTRWALGGSANDGYARRFTELAAAGEDVHGEARLADALLPRGASVLDAGSGIGRVGAELLRRGHRVVAVENDPALVARSRTIYPELPVVAADLVHTTPDLLSGLGHPPAYDLVVAVGNVMVFLAEGTETAVLARLRGLLAPGGRLLVGFHLRGGPPTARSWSAAGFEADLEAVGLQVTLRAGTYELHPPDEDYGVWLLARK